MLFPVSPLQHHHRHCGREVFSVAADLPTGNTPAAAHFRRMVELLLDFAEKTYLPQAEAALDTALQNGQGHRFFSYRYRVKFEIRQENGSFCLALSVTLSAGGRILFCNRSVSFWDSTLSLQYPSAADAERAFQRQKRRGAASPSKKSK